MNDLEFHADGVKIKISAECDSGDVHIEIDGRDEVIVSRRVAAIIGLALIDMAEKDPDA